MAERVYTQSFGVVGAIIEKDNKILLVKEAGTIDRGKWNQPAGWIDVGENPVDWIKVEVKQETGLDFKPKGLIGVYSLVKHLPYEVRGSKICDAVKLIFHGEIIGGELIKSNDEISETRWFTPQEILNMGPDTLRDSDIKQEVQDYFAGRSFPLDIIRHTVQT